MSNTKRAISNNDCPEIFLTESSTSHLFRHASEITRETKGGYLQGKIRLPGDVSEGTRSVFIRISLVPTIINHENNPFHLHPNLLHINMRTNKKNRKLQDGELPDDVDWSFIFKVEDDDVFRVCSKSNKDKRFHQRAIESQKGYKGRVFISESGETITEEQARILEDNHRKHFVGKLKRSQSGSEPLSLGELNLPIQHHLTRISSLKDGTIELGSSGLMLNVITPLQKFSKGGTTITDVMRQRFNDLFHLEILNETLSETEDFFTKKKEDRIKMQQVKLLVEFFNADTQMFETSCISDTITNSKSKECGPLQLHDLSPAVSCCESETKIFVLSWFKLVSDVRANFILYDPDKDSVVYDKHEDLMRSIRQPKDCSVFNQTVLCFKAPKQDYRVIKRIEELKLQLRLAAYRPSDKKMSSNSFAFVYLEHCGNPFDKEVKDNPTRFSQCAFCNMTNKSTLLEQSDKELPNAKPGVARRIAKLQNIPKYLDSGQNDSSKKDSDTDDDLREQSEQQSPSPPGKNEGNLLVPKPITSLLSPNTLKNNGQSSLLATMSQNLMQELYHHKDKDSISKDNSSEPRIYKEIYQNRKRTHLDVFRHPEQTPSCLAATSATSSLLTKSSAGSISTFQSTRILPKSSTSTTSHLEQSAILSPKPQVSLATNEVLDMKIEQDSVVERVDVAKIARKQSPATPQSTSETPIKQERDIVALEMRQPTGLHGTHLTLPCPPMKPVLLQRRSPLARLDVPKSIASSDSD